MEEGADKTPQPPKKRTREDILSPGALVEAYNPLDGSFYRSLVLCMNHKKCTVDLQPLGFDNPDHDWPLSQVYYPVREAPLAIEVWQGKRVEVCLPQYNNSWWKGTIVSGDSPIIIQYDDGETLPFESGQEMRNETE